MMLKNELSSQDLAMQVMNEYARFGEIQKITKKQVANLLQTNILDEDHIYDTIDLYLTPKIQKIFLDLYFQKRTFKSITGFEKVLLAYGYFFSFRKNDLRKFLKSQNCPSKLLKYFQDHVIKNYILCDELKQNLFLAFKSATSFTIVMQQYDKNLPFQGHTQTLGTSDSGIGETSGKRSGNPQTQTLEA